MNPLLVGHTSATIVPYAMRPARAPGRQLLPLKEAKKTAPPATSPLFLMMPSATSARAAISKAVADAVPCGASVCQGLVQAQSSQPSWAWCKTLPAGLPASSPASFLTKAADALPGSQSDDSRTLWPKSRIGPALTNRLHWGSVLHIAHSTTIAASNQKNTARPLGPKHASEHEHEGSLDNEELLEAVDARLSRVLPEHPDAATIRELIRKMEQLKQEKARLAMFRHQTPKEIRSEYLQMMLTGLFTGLAAAIHPIFFIGSVCGLVRMRRSRVAEVDRDSGTKKVEEINREIKEIRADLNSLLDGISDMCFLFPVEAFTMPERLPPRAIGKQTHPS
ncbi:hypothetical protein cyc_00873 [Cyclospora cayetanensis]|uniref:Transmembrane protein n=1 Tax=Cyclospora cayetanensis TaxID=88456 RepID=A0A1D3CVA4_9EIME|nr:hypothetical protein cyc_00873 [Cyclospora cayetanensis]